MVKSVCSSYAGLDLILPCTLGSSQQPVTPAPRNVRPSSGLHTADTIGTHTHHFKNNSVKKMNSKARAAGL